MKLYILGKKSLATGLNCSLFHLSKHNIENKLINVYIDATAKKIARIDENSLNNA